MEMAAVTALSCMTLQFVCVDAFVSAGQKELSVKHGEDATLECYGPRDAVITLLRWSQPDLKSDHYVFYLKEGSFHEDYQLPSFKGRVHLKDPEMKDEDFSVILQNITVSDTGKYECCAGYGNPNDVQLLSTINLKVEEPGPGGTSEDGGKGAGVSNAVSPGPAVQDVQFLVLCCCWFCVVCCNL